MPSTISTEKDPSNHLSEPVIIFAPVNLSVLYFLYGIYVLLFGTLIHISRNSKRYEGSNSNFYLWLTITLFVLATIFAINYTVFSLRESWALLTVFETGVNYQYLRSDIERRVSLSIQRFTFLFINIAADCMLIHRCYVIWGSRRWIAASLIVASLATNTLGLVGSVTVIIGQDSSIPQSSSEFCAVGNGLVFAYCIANTMVNLVITFLTAGRIWWIHRQVRAQGIHTSDGYLDSVVRIILESGLIYPICLCVHLVVAHVAPPHNLTLYPLGPLSAGIAPTLIMVRAKFVKNVESFQDHVTSIRFISRPAPNLDKERDTITITDEQMNSIRETQPELGENIAKREDISVLILT